MVMAIDILFEKEARLFRRADTVLRKVEKSAGDEKSGAFNAAVHQLFGFEKGQPIVRPTENMQLGDVSEQVMNALRAGYDFSAEIAKTVPGSKAGEREFLEAMSFLNRKEVKYARSFFSVIRFMSGIALIQSTRNYYDAFEGIRQKERGRQGLAIIKNEWIVGAWKTYKNWGGGGLFDQMTTEVNHVEELGKFLIDKASLAVKTE